MNTTDKLTELPINFVLSFPLKQSYSHWNKEKIFWKNFKNKSYLNFRCGNAFLKGSNCTENFFFVSMGINFVLCWGKTHKVYGYVHQLTWLI